MISLYNFVHLVPRLNSMFGKIHLASYNFNNFGHLVGGDPAASSWRDGFLSGLFLKKNVFWSLGIGGVSAWHGGWSPCSL